MIMADDLALMDAGRVIQAGTPRDLYTAPTSVAAARLLGPVNLVPAEVRHGLATSILGQAPAAMADGAGLMGVRPTDITLGGPGAGVEARVVSIGYAGAYCVIRAACGSHILSIHMADPLPDIGAQVGLAVDAARLMVLPST